MERLALISLLRTSYLSTSW